MCRSKILQYYFDVIYNNRYIKLLFRFSHVLDDLGRYTIYTSWYENIDFERLKKIIKTKL